MRGFLFMRNSRLKILSVDDNRILNLMRQKVLEVNGFDCDLAYTAEQALAQVMTCHYEAILLDYYLPGTTGLQVAETMKTLRPAVPIILVTGEETCERSELIESYLVKGDGPEALIQRLRSVLRAGSAKAMGAIAS
jgi:DNA-binding response OmpR family regulator